MKQIKNFLIESCNIYEGEYIPAKNKDDDMKSYFSDEMLHPMPKQVKSEILDLIEKLNEVSGLNWEYIDCAVDNGKNMYHEYLCLKAFDDEKPDTECMFKVGQYSTKMGAMDDESEVICCVRKKSAPIAKYIKMRVTYVRPIENLKELFTDDEFNKFVYKNVPEVTSAF